MHLKITHSIIFIVCIFMAGCEAEVDNDGESASDVAIAFFDAIYNQGDINKAQTLCSPEFAAKIASFVTTKNVARRLFNMSFDSVEIHSALGDVNVKQEFMKSGKLTVVFTGYRHGKIYKDLKKIRLVEKNGEYLVDELLDDPYN